MYNHINGRLVEKTPTHAIIEAGGVGYLLVISLNTYSKLKDEENCKLYVHFTVREDAHILYGFADTKERDIFRQLTSVSGVGPSTARMILSSLSPDELAQEIAAGNAKAIQAVKGVGAKSAQRIIVDLADKISLDNEISDVKIVSSGNTVKFEALSALTLLGFDKKKAEKVIEMIVNNSTTDLRVEELIKESLKKL
jgi:Holliday junction DNA helicase RuvA